MGNVTTARYRLRAEADPNPELGLDLRTLGMLRRYGYYLGLPTALTGERKRKPKRPIPPGWEDFVRSIDEITFDVGWTDFKRSILEIT